MDAEPTVVEKLESPYRSALEQVAAMKNESPGTRTYEAALFELLGINTAIAAAVAEIDQANTDNAKNG